MAGMWWEGPVLACGGGSLHLVCIYILDTFVLGPFCPFVFIYELMHSHHSHTCIKGKVAGKQVVQEGAVSTSPFWKRPYSYRKCWCWPFPSSLSLSDNAASSLSATHLRGRTHQGSQTKQTREGKNQKVESNNTNPTVPMPHKYPVV